MLSKASFWKAVIFTVAALAAALVVGYACYAGHKAFPEGEPIFTTEEIRSDEQEPIYDTLPEYPE